MEDWTDIMYINMYGSANFGYDESTYQMLEKLGVEEVKSSATPIVSSVYFISFILTGAMIVLNLFVGVMLTGMDEAKKENKLLDAVKRQTSDEIDINAEILEMEKQLREMSEKLSQNLLVLNKRVQDNSRNIKKISEGN